MAGHGREERHKRAAPASSCDVEVRCRPQRHEKRVDGSGCDVVARSAEATTGDLATRQEGAVKRSQLLQAGVGASVIKRLIRTGTLHRRHHGVYIVGHLALAPYANESAALLACGDRTVISHRSAAFLWGLASRPGDVDVTLIRRQCRPKRGIRLHRVAALEARDVRRRHALPVTSPARTVIDLAADAGDGELEKVIAAGRSAGLLRDGELERALELAGSRPGTGRLRRLLSAEGATGITRSEGERILRRYLRAAGLPLFGTNRRIGAWELDFLWAGERLVVELDSYEFHKDRAAFERDRRKDMALRDAGYTVIRITGRQLIDEPLLVIAHVARALDRATRASG